MYYILLRILIPIIIAFLFTGFSALFSALVTHETFGFRHTNNVIRKLEAKLTT